MSECTEISCGWNEDKTSGKLYSLQFQQQGIGTMRIEFNELNFIQALIETLIHAKANLK